MSASLSIPLLPQDTAPGNYLVESDQSQFATALATNRVACCFYATQGSMLPKEITTPQQFVLEYGNPNPNISLAHYSILKALKASASILAQRVVSTGAALAFGSVDVLFGAYSAPMANGSGSWKRGPYITNTAWSDLDFAACFQPSITVALTSGAASFELDVDLNGTTVTIGPVSTPTLDTVISAINGTAAFNDDSTTINGQNLTSGGFACQSSTLNSAVAKLNSTAITIPSNWITIIFPASSTPSISTLTGATVVDAPNWTGGNSDYSIPLIGSTDESNVFNVFGKSFGAYANGEIGFNVSNYRAGQNSATMIDVTSAANFASGFALNSFSMQFNSTPVQLNTAIDWATSNQTTAEDMADKLQAIMPKDSFGNYMALVAIVYPTGTGSAPYNAYTFAGNSASPTALNFLAETDILAAEAMSFANNFTLSGVANETAADDLLIIIFTANNSSDMEINTTGSYPISKTVASFTIPSGSAPTTAVQSISNSTISYTAPPKTFDFNVYSAANTKTPLETFTVSLNQQVSAQGQQQYIETRVNSELTGSQYVRVAVNPYANWSSFVMSYLTSIADVAAGKAPGTSSTVPITWLENGADGATPTSSEIAAAWTDTFTSLENSTVDTLLQGGYTDAVVAQAMDQVANSRMDCESWIDVPSTINTTAQDFIDWRKNVLGIDSNRTFIFGPDAQINDTYTGKLIYVPMSGFAVAKQVFVDEQVGPQQMAAGLTYGTLSGIVGLRVYFQKTARGLLNGAGINIAKRTRSGPIAIYGAKTAQVTASLLMYIPIRRMFTVIEQEILKFMENVDFLNITPNLETQTQQKIKGICQLYQNNGAIAAYKVITGASVNTTQYTDNGQFNVRVIIVPYVPAQFAVLDGVLTNSSSNFSEYTVNG